MPRKKIDIDPAERQKMKNSSRKKHQHSLRGAMAVSDYLLLTAIEQHRQATAFIDQLEQKYPTKRDVRKTPEFRKWQREQMMLLNQQSPLPDQKEMPIPTPKDNTKGEKEMVLRIPLMDTKAKETQAVPEDQLMSIFNHIPEGVMNEMLAEIRSDPQLDAIMNDFSLYEEVVMDEGTVLYEKEMDIDIDLELGDPLGDEINSLLYY